MYGDVINDPKTLRLSDATFRGWVLLLCVASNNGGVLPPMADLEIHLRMKPQRIAALLVELVARELFDKLEDGTFKPHNWDKRQYKSDTSTSRVQRFRERQRNVSSDVSETAPETETDTDTEKHSRPVKARPPREPSRFEEFWQVYPRREGGNPRKPAETKFDALVKAGTDPQVMIDAAKKLASDEAARGNIGSRFIPMASTWLNQQRWSDHAEVAAAEPAPGDGIEAQLEGAVRMYAKNGFWSRWAGPAPGMTGCRASAELLAKHGLDIAGRRVTVAAA